MNIAITGATGFIGTSLTHHLLRAGHKVTVVVRPNSVLTAQQVTVVRVNDIAELLPGAFKGIEMVIHGAGIAHARASPADFARVNVRGARAVCDACSNAGVRRLVFLSSVKVNGETTLEPLIPASPTAPEDSYGRSKLEAEQILAAGRAECVILRLPLVYGRGAPANFAALVRLVRLGVPLPFGGVAAKRSYLALDNLVDFVDATLAWQAPPGQVFYVSDPESLCLPELLAEMGRAMGRPVRLFAVSPALLKVLVSAVVGKTRARKLLGSLEVDTVETRKLTGWSPPHSTAQALQRMFGHSG